MATPIELGSPHVAGVYLANLIKFLMTRISPAARGKSINNLKSKIYYINEYELASKKIPASAAIGQSLTFIKHLLIEQNPAYIREVLNNIVRHL